MLTVKIRHLADGLERTFSDSSEEDGDGGIRFMWAEGNYSCDCNRALFFARAAGEPCEDPPCGEEEFRVTISAPDGRVIYSDMPA